jgi:hypothetical protein
MRLAAIALAVALVVFAPSRVRADIVTYDLTLKNINAGTAGFADLPIFQGPVAYTFTVNTAIKDADPDPNHGSYPGALISSSGQIGSYKFSTGSGAIDVNLAVDQAGVIGQSFTIFAKPTSGANIGAFILRVVSVTLEGGTTAFQSDAFPSSIPLNAFSLHRKLDLIFNSVWGSTANADNPEVIVGVGGINLVTGEASNPVSAPVLLVRPPLGRRFPLTRLRRTLSTLRRASTERLRMAQRCRARSSHCIF